MSNILKFISNDDGSNVDIWRIHKFPNKTELKTMERGEILRIVDLLCEDCVASFHVRMNQNQFMTNLALELTDRMRKEGLFNKETFKNYVKAENKQESVAYDPSKSIYANFGRDTIEGKLARILVEVLGIKPDKIYMTSYIGRDLGADSLDNIELVMAVEEEFGLDITDEEAVSIKTFEDAVKFVRNKLYEDSVNFVKDRVK